MDRIIENGEVLDHGWSSDYGWGSGGGYLSRSEKAVWTNGTMTYQYAVVEGVNYSDQSSDGYWDYSVDVLSHGTPVWYGRERGPSQIDLWVGGDPLSRRYDLGEWDWRRTMSSQHRWMDVDDAGQVSWLAAKVPDETMHVFEGSHDLTAATGQPGSQDWIGINASGQVLWASGKLYLDEQRLPCNDVLQLGDVTLPFGMSDRGDVLWQRRHQIGSYIYRYASNLTADLYRDTGFIHSKPLALDNAGQVLWAVNTLDGKSGPSTPPPPSLSREQLSFFPPGVCCYS